MVYLVIAILLLFNKLLFKSLGLTKKVHKLESCSINEIIDWQNCSTKTNQYLELW